MNSAYMKVLNPNVTTYVEDGEMYLSLSGETHYKIDGMSERKEFIIPKIKLDKMLIQKNAETHYVLDSKGNRTYGYEIGSEPTLVLGIVPNDKGELMRITLLEPVEKEMTIEEIEKELGYKIKMKK